MIGSEIGGYRIEAELGRGGMGVVYRAVDTRLGRKVALKVLPAEFGDDPGFRARFLRESRVAASLDHPGVIPIFEAGEADGQLYIAMRHVDGTDLGDLLRSAGALSPDRTLDLAEQLAAALDAAHERGLVHRDVKPSNVLVSESGGKEHVYLCDFGLSKEVADSTLSAPGGFVGTVRYMAPEVIRGGAATARSDLYSLACVLVECLTGEAPFTGPSEAAIIYGHLEQPPPRPSERRAGLPRALDSVLARALDKDPGRRFASGAELVAAARAALGGARAPRTPIAVRAPRVLQRRRGRTAAAAVAAAVAVGAVVAVALSGDTPGLASIRGDAVAVIDPGKASLLGQVRLDGSPAGVASSPGAIWVADEDRGVVSRVDPETRTIRQTIAVGHGPSAIAVEARGVWVANREDGSLSVISPQTNQVVDTVRIGRTVDGVCVAAGAVWATSPLDYSVVQVDPESGRVRNTVRLDSQPAQLACARGSVWVSSPSAGSVTEVDAATSTAVKTIQVGRGASGLAAAAHGVWVTNAAEGTVSRIDPSRGAVVATIAVGAGDAPADVATTRDEVYVSSELSGTIVRIDPSRAAVVEKLRVGHRPQGLAVVDGTLWAGIADKGERHRGGMLRVEYPLEGTWADIDPALGYSPQGLELLSVAYDGLTAFRREGGVGGATLVANLAESVPGPQDGGRSYSFRLRRGLVYSTGAPVLASHIRFAIERTLRNLPPAREIFRHVQGASACTPKRCSLSRGIVTDDKARTVVFRLSEPDPDLPLTLALPFAAALPPAVGLTAPAERPLPSTGPYRIAELKVGESVRLERNPRFRSWSAIGRPDGYPDVISAGFVPDAKGSVERVLAGRVDRIGGFGMLTPDQVVTLRRRAASQLRQTIAGNTVSFTVNTRSAPFDRLDARRAVAYALDRGDMVDAAGGPDIAQATCQLLPPGLPGSRPYCPFTMDGTPAGRPDVARARRLVRRSGTRGMRVTVMALAPLSPAIGSTMARTLRRIGYDAKVLSLSPVALFESVPDTRKDFQIAIWPLVSTGIPSPTEALTAFTCDALIPRSPLNANTARFCDREYDRLVAEATRLQAVAPAAADRLWAQAERLIVDQAPMVGAYYRVWNDLVSERLGNFQYNPALGMLLDQAWVR